MAAPATMGLSSPRAATGMATVLYANAQNRLDLMVDSVLRDSRMASGTAVSSLRTTVMSAACMAASVPEPMAIPRSEVVRAGASLTPSPTMATTWPSERSFSMAWTLPSGVTSAITSAGSMPTCSATERATAALSPVSRMGRSPRSLSSAIAAGASSFTVSRRSTNPASRPSTATRMVVVPPARASSRASDSSVFRRTPFSCSQDSRPTTTKRAFMPSGT